MKSDSTYFEIQENTVCTYTTGMPSSLSGTQKIIITLKTVKKETITLEREEIK